MTIRPMIAAGAMIVAAGFAWGETWERFRGPNGEGVANNQNLPVEFGVSKNLIWKAPIPGQGNSSPIIWNDRLFIQSASASGDERILLCLDAKTGKTLWEKRTPGTKAATHQKNTLASASPTTDGERVFAATWNGKDILLNAYTIDGKSLWEKNLGAFKSQHGPGASPVLYKDKLIYHFDMDGKSILYVFDKETGKVLWQDDRPPARACYTAPRILEKGANGTELIIATTGGITSYNPESGSRNWNWTWTWEGKKAEPLRLVAETVLVGDMLCAFSGTSSERQTVGLKLPSTASATPTKEWKNTKDFPYVPSPVVHDGLLYFANDRGFAGCFDAKTGKSIYLQRVEGGTFTASPVVVDGKIYAASEEGDVVVYPASPKFEILATNKIGERIRATPAVADGRIVIRGEHHLFCFGKK